MSPRTPLTPERKAALKKDVLDGIDSAVASKKIDSKIVLSRTTPVRLVKKSALQPKKSLVVKKLSTPKPIIKKVVRPVVKRSPTNSRIVSDFTNIAPSERIILQNNEIKSRVSPLIQRIRGFGISQKQEPIDNFFAKPIQKQKKGLVFYLVRIVIFLVILAILALCVDIYGIYKLNWRDSISNQVVRVLPLPAATVNGKTIKLSDYFDDIDLLQTAIDNQREGLEGGVISPLNKDSIIDRLVLIRLIDEQLNKYGKSISDQELNSNLDAIIAQFNGRVEAENSVKKLYGINLDQFKVKVLKPLLSKNLLQSLIVKDENLNINKEAKAKAVDVLSLALKPGANFTELARQYTEDEAGINTGGDLGFISKGQATLEIEQILFSLPANTVYDKIVTNNVGYHIIMVENKLINSQDGKESVKAKQIFVKVDVDKYLRDLLAKSRIVKYVK